MGRLAPAARPSCATTERRLPTYRGTHSETAPENFGAVVADCARDWMSVLTGAQHRQDVDTERWLAGLVVRLATLLRAEPFEPAPAAELGAALGAGHHTDSHLLVRTGQVLDRWLPALAGRADLDSHRRLTHLLTAMCAGF